MMSFEQHKRELLAKLINGTINESEQHELERLALDDPFLFDALEGISLNYDKINPDQINAIKFGQPKAHSESDELKYLPIRRFLKIAAGFIILAAAGFFVKQQIQINESTAPMLVSEEIQETSEILVQDLYQKKQYIEPAVDLVEKENLEVPEPKLKSAKRSETSKKEPIRIYEKKEANFYEVSNDQKSDMASGSAEISAESEEIVKSRRSSTANNYVDGLRLESPSSAIMDAQTNEDILKADSILSIEPLIGFEAFKSSLEIFKKQHSYCNGLRTYILQFGTTGLLQNIDLGDRDEDQCDTQFSKFLGETRKWSSSNSGVTFSYKLEIDFDSN